MKILLVYPTRLDRNNRPIKYRKAFPPPLSLAVLSGATPKQHEVTVVNDIAETIDFSQHYDLVGITAMTTQAPRAYQIADRFRERGVKVVIGGVHATFLPDEVQCHADAVALGEAEGIWEKIVTDFECGSPKARYNGDGTFDPAKGPMPSWQGFNMSIYPKMPGTKHTIMPVYTTRGCPYGCDFCSVTKFFGTKYRTKPVEKVLAEIDNTGARRIFFVDDNIACRPAYSRELFQALRKRNVTWFSQVSTRVLKHPELLDLAAKSGCEFLLVGIESINESCLDSVGKGFNNVVQYAELFERMHRVGIVPYASVIFGFDSEFVETFSATTRFLKKHLVGNAAFFLLTPLPGTNLFDRLSRENRLFHKDWSRYNLTNVVFEPKNFSASKLTEEYWRTFQDYYSLTNIVPRIAGITRASNHSKVESFLLASFFQFYFRRILARREHPFAGGFERIT